MQLELIKNPDASQGAAYKIARVVYAETGATSLSVTEAFTSMIANISRATGIAPDVIINDATLFPSLCPDNARHKLLGVAPDSRAFQMCLRVARRMLRGNLGDSCFGATRFHRTDEMPQWAMSRGYIADVDGILFYLQD